MRSNQELSVKWTLERRIRHSLMHRDLRENNMQVCYFCSRTFFKFSQELHEHLLFDHGFFLAHCKSHVQKKLDDNCFKGWLMRKEIRVAKRSKYNNPVVRRMLWRGRISNFFGNFE